MNPTMQIISDRNPKPNLSYNERKKLRRLVLNTINFLQSDVEYHTDESKEPLEGQHKKVNHWRKEINMYRRILEKI